MLAPLIALFAQLVGPKLAKPVLIASAVSLLVIGLGVAKCAYDRSVIKSYTQNVEIKAQAADANAAAAHEKTDATIAHDTQEIDNALAPLPDAKLSDRQRARACAILVRQHPGDPKPKGC